MAFFIVYENNGFQKREKYSSYYEFIKAKKDFKDKGIPIQILTTEGDFLESKPQKKISAADKACMREFLKKYQNVNLHTIKDRARREQNAE